MLSIPAGFEHDLDPQLDLDAALTNYGLPDMRNVSLKVTQDTIAYWHRVRRKRVAEVVLILPNHNDQYLVHTKAFYPSGAYRLLSGGIKSGEALCDAVLREAHEETGQHAKLERFAGTLWTSFRHQDQVQRFTSYLFLLQPVAGEIHSLDPGEQISDYRFVSIKELEQLTDELETLPEDWIDWGRFRAAGHRLAIEALRVS